MARTIIKCAELHSAIMIPGGKTEKFMDTTKLPGALLEWEHPAGLWITFKGYETFTPATNVKSTTFPMGQKFEQATKTVKKSEPTKDAPSQMN